MKYSKDVKKLFKENEEHFLTDRKVPTFTARKLKEILEQLPEEYLDYYMVVQREQHFYDLVEVEQLDEVYYRLYEGNQALVSKEYYYKNKEDFNNIPIVYSLNKGQLVFHVFGSSKH